MLIKIINFFVLKIANNFFCIWKSFY